MTTFPTSKSELDRITRILEADFHVPVDPHLLALQEIEVRLSEIYQAVRALASALDTRSEVQDR